jgi:phage-related protein
VADETKIRVRLDTRQAKTELGGLVREGRTAAGKVASNLRSVVGKGLGAAGFGGAVGAGFAAVRGATESGVGDVVGEALGGIGAQAEQFFLGSMGEEARATRSAREETIQAFGAIAGATNAIPPGAREFFDSVKSIAKDSEHGRTLFETNEQFRGPGIGDMIDKIMEGLSKLLNMAVDNLISKIPFVGGK